MRIYFIDTILESHVPDSLIAGLRRLGHTVKTTGKIWHGAEFPNTDEDRKKLARVVTDVIAWKPDAVFVMRACALMPRQLKRLREAGITTAVWFSDDPVFFEKQGIPVASHYDVTFHTATKRILEKYESELDVRGIGLQFWTSQDHFPRQYDPARCDLDVLFIGNAHTPVRYWRYDWLAGLPVKRAMYGLVREDTEGIVAGVLDNDAELARACVRGRFGLSVGQRFEDYKGTGFDFPGLADLGEFPLPSRIVQFASVGTPIIELVKYSEAKSDLQRLFPPVKCVTADDEIAAAVQQVHDDAAALQALSDETYQWFEAHYSADARATFVQAVLANPSKYRKMSAEQRAFAFLDYTPLTGLRLVTSKAGTRARDFLKCVVRYVRRRFARKSG